MMFETVHDVFFVSKGSTRFSGYDFCPAGLLLCMFVGESWAFICQPALDVYDELLLKS